jgi:FixJ family two-component response regulator
MKPTTQVGAVGFFVKPFDDQGFLALVHQALGQVVPDKTKI